MTLACRTLDAGSEPAWDRFVEATPEATFFHRAGWRQVLETAFGHRTRFLYTERDGGITGILPLAQVKTRLFGNTIISLPFCVYGGPVALDAESADVLLAEARTMRERASAPVLELRPRDAQASLSQADGWQTRGDLYATFRKAISGDHDANMKAIPRKQRAMVRKGIERKLAARSDRDVDRLHAIYAESVRNLGTPVFSRRYFRILAEVFGPAVDVVTVADGEKPVASVLNFYFREEVLPYYGGGTQAAREVHAYDFMYWEVMRRAADRGCRLFDYGRSKLGTGAFAFKKNWGFEPQPLTYHYLLRDGAKIPDHNPLNPKYRLFIAAWKRLPLPIANAVGPQIVRGIG